MIDEEAQKEYTARLQSQSRLQIKLSPIKGQAQRSVQSTARQLLQKSRRRKRKLLPNLISFTDWEFYDLGTRLRAVDTPSTAANLIRDLDDVSPLNYTVGKYLEYAELAFFGTGTMTQLQGEGVPPGGLDVYSVEPVDINHVNVTPTNPNELLEWDAKAIGLVDGTRPLKFTKIGNEEVAHCLPIWHGGTNNNKLSTIQFDLRVYRSSDNVQIGSIQNVPGDIDWELKDIYLDPAIWNSLDLLVNNTDVSNTGKNDRTVFVDETKSELVQLKFTCVTGYEDFDTRDTVNYKVTSQPSFTSPEVEFKLKKNQGLRFYLKPKWLGYFVEHSFLTSAQVSYQSYRVNNAGTWYNNFQSLSTGAGTSLQLGWWVLQINNANGNPDRPVTEGTLDVSLNPDTGDYTITNYPGGITVSGTGTLVINPGFRSNWYVPNTVVGGYEFNLSWTKPNVGDTGYANPLTGSAAYTMAWSSYAFNSGSPDLVLLYFSQLTGAVQRGPKIGRIQVIPTLTTKSTVAGGRVIDPGWNRSTNFTRTYDNASSKLYDDIVAGQFPGRALYPFFSNSGSPKDLNISWAYKRNTAPETEDFLTVLQKYKITIPPNYPALYPETLVLDFESPVWNTKSSPGGLQAIMTQAMVNALAVTDALQAYPHIRSVSVGGSGATPYDEDFQLKAVEIDVPVGTLCAILRKTTGTYYIWRKTAGIRSGRDYERNQMLLDYRSEDSSIYV